MRQLMITSCANALSFSDNFLGHEGGVSQKIENYFIKPKAKVLKKGLYECEARTFGQKLDSSGNP